MFDLRSFMFWQVPNSRRVAEPDFEILPINVSSFSQSATLALKYTSGATKSAQATGAIWFMIWIAAVLVQVAERGGRAPGDSC